MASKECVVKSSAPKKIAKIQFGTMDNIEIHRTSEVQISSRELFQMPLRVPAPYGCMDSRLGVSDKMANCQTCSKKLIDCAGHFGFIRLELPVFHAGYFRHTLTILQCICKQCARMMLTVSDRLMFLKKMRNPNADAFSKGNIHKKIISICKKTSQCPYCSYCNGVVKKVTSGGCFKIVHEKFRAKGVNPISASEAAAQKKIGDDYSELKPYLVKSQEMLTPMRAHELIKLISEDDMTLLWMNEHFGRAENLIMWTVPVAPVPIRPSVPMDMGGGSTEDDITMKLQEIIDVNNALKMALENGATMKMVAEDWDFLQIQTAQLINGETPGIPRALMGPKPIRGFCQRLKGKQGRFRGNLSGKRVDFSARTVISPDPNLHVQQVGVPFHVAKVMTYPEMVNRYNIEQLRQNVLNGPETHPGANLIRSANGFTKTLVYANREKCAAMLRIGDIVERHMHDGDYVLFNRQPSLHKMSIMAHRVKVMPWRTFRFNECCCTPYNADFDGDEMNLHFPQTEEAKAEAAELMAVSNNLVTPRNGEPLVAATQDFLTGSYLLTQKDVFFNRSDFCRLVAYLSDATEVIQLPPPVIWKPQKLWTGKQIISLLVRPNADSIATVNLESTEKFYTSGEHMCPHDGYVVFRRGELLCGTLGKKTLGDSSKKSLFFVLIRDCGNAEATRCMSRLAKLCARYLGDRGFSIGIEDVTPTPSMLALKSRILHEGQKEAKELIDLYNSGHIRLKPGCNALQSLESEVNGILGRIRERCGQEAMNNLHYRNAPLTMAKCGSKGSPLNISQMISCLGQQSVGGSRIQDGFVNRTLPHFALGSLLPDAKGFVGNSFYSGLTATEFFFHTMGGREGLVDTAVKTAETGYMARRLMKALEDLSMQYDKTVRNSEQTVVQFSYGDDGLNPSVMEAGDRPVDYNRLMINVCLQPKEQGKVHVAKEVSGRSRSSSLVDSEDGALDRAMTAAEIRSTIEARVEENCFTRLLPQGQQFITETLKFFNDLAHDLEKLENMAVGCVGGTNELKQQMVTSRKGQSTDELRTYLRSLSPADKRQWQKKAVVPNSTAYKQAQQMLCDNVLMLTKRQMISIIQTALKKYSGAYIEAGEAVGAVGAQSLSEPGTQMTLKTFHFAGVASMNVTLGVPRLKEIINASKSISTPIIEARLVQADSMTSARIVKAQIERTVLGEITDCICEVHSAKQSYIYIKLDMEAIQNLHLNVNAHTIKASILQGIGAPKAAVLRALRDKHVMVVGGKGNKLRILPPDAKDTPQGIPGHQKIYFSIQALKAVLPCVMVQGIPSVSRAIINESEQLGPNGKKNYYLLVEGYGLSDVMGAPGVDGPMTKTNHVLEMQTTLGIEAARHMIADEIRYIMQAYGITVDRRHLLLLSDVMTFKGEVLGITRFGVAKMRESVLMLASFEKTTDHLFDAAVHSREDSIIGVSECIIMGVPVPIGTGLFKLMNRPVGKDGASMNAHKLNNICAPRRRLLDTLNDSDIVHPDDHRVV